MTEKTATVSTAISIGDIGGRSQQYQSQRHCSVSDLCQIFSLLLKTPTKQLAGGMISGNLFEDLQNVLLELGFDSLAKAAEFTKSRQYCASQNTEDLLHELRREYTRLFIKTSKDPEVAIYEALFIAKHKGSGSQPLMFVNPEAIELSAIYKRVGIVRNRDFNYSEDHFAFQFIFLSKLHQILGLVEEHQEDFSQLLEEYHEKHFDRWSVDFFAECEKASLIETYRTFWQLGKDISATLIAEQIAQRKEELVI